ncbi:MAG: hypothetical protein ABIL39_10725 [candidate division WOR-3 bacterium]
MTLRNNHKDIIAEIRNSIISMHAEIRLVAKKKRNPEAALIIIAKHLMKVEENLKKLQKNGF